MCGSPCETWSMEYYYSTSLQINNNVSTCPLLRWAGPSEMTILPRLQLIF